MASASFWGSGIGMILIYVIIIGGFYLIAIRPQKKKEKEHRALVESVAVGDSILTTSGFYGVVIDMTDDVVIVEFGNNKNCRIPMQRAAIVEVDKGEEA
ncbi:MAG: preprotein translocase subunit YajC [Eubacterium sp.]|nr:preprotein translocase subunit YajC [Eubacterium sp.]